MKRCYALLIFLLLPYFIFASLEVHFVDVGQGDAIIINADGHFGVIDGGTAAQSRKLYSYLKDLNPAPLELIVISHTDLDHIGGIGSTIEAAGISKNCTVWCNDPYSSSRQFSSFKSKIEQTKCKIVEPIIGTVKMLGNAQITVLGPITKTGNKNQDSLTLRLDYKGKSFLFMGDADWLSENRLINQYASSDTDWNNYKSDLLSADVLKVGHHGSTSSTSQYFLRFVHPSISIISVGANNRYGHPDEDALSRLIQSESEIYRTDIHGTIKIRVEDSGLMTVITQKGNGPWMDESLLPSYIRNTN